MILRFRLGNYRSFRKDNELSLVPTALSRKSAVRLQAGDREVDVLPVLGVFGANASGKSNLVGALKFMVEAVRSSHTKWSPDQAILRQPFALDEEAGTTATLFEIDFVSNGQRFQYGFEAEDKRFVSEWLYAFPFGRRQTLYEREDDQYSFGKNLTGPNRLVSEITRPNSLFLSAAATANHEQLSQIFAWFQDHIRISDPNNRAEDAEMTKSLIREGRDSRIRELLARADLGIIEAVVGSQEIPDEMRQTYQRIISAMVRDDDPEREAKLQSLLSGIKPEMEVVSLVHQASGSGVPIAFDEESLGTRTWFSLIGPILWALDGGNSLVVDEVDSSLHPTLVSYAIRLFGDSSVNRSRAQLIFTAHDTTPMGQLLGDAILGRDQTWFVEKDSDGASHLIPLSDFRPRKGENLQRGYLQGRYGGAPKTSWFALREAVQKEVAEVQ